MIKFYLTIFLLTLLTFILINCTQVLAQQLPQINYQGVARKTDGSPIQEQQITLRLTIRDGGADSPGIYSETRQLTTNKFGLFTTVIGSSGAVSKSGTMNAVNWSTGNKFLQVEIDPQGGNSFVNMGASQLQSVPYAIYANTAAPSGNAGGDLSGTYPNPTVSKLQGADVSNAVPNTGQVLKWNGKVWLPSDEEGALGTLSASLPIKSSTAGRNSTISIEKADATADGYISKTDWLIFNGKASTSYVDAAVAAVLTPETNRATAAEGTLTTNLASEVTRATAVEAAKEALVNKSTDVTTDAASDTKYPSVKSVKTYVDAASTTSATALSSEVTRATTAEGTLTTNLNSEITRATAAEAAKEALANKSTSVTTDAASDTKYPSVKSVKTYVDAASATYSTALSSEVTRATTAEGTLTTNLTAEVTRATAAEAAKEALANKSTSVTTDAASDTKYPSVKSVKTYVDAASTTSATALSSEVTRATTAEGTLATNLTAEVTRATAAEGTLTTNLASEVTRATAAEAAKEALVNKSTDVTTDAASDTKYPSVKSVKSYVDASIVSGATPDATGTVKGKLQLAGDLTGTAALPTIAAGAIDNGKIAAAAAIADTKLATISTTGKVSNSATTATSVNTISAIVARDASGNFSAGTITAALTGNASTSTSAGTASNIAGGILGGVPYQSAAGVTTILAGNATATQKFLTQTGNGTVSAAPDWSVLTAGDIPSLSATYLPLTGGTMSGGLTGTTASLSGNTSVGGTLSVTGNLSASGTANSLGTITTGIWNAGAVTSSGAITGTSLVKSGGTAVQFLKADGSVDANTYLTTGGGTSTYLPLSGGTLTGALTGTSAALSGNTSVGGTLGVTGNLSASGTANSLGTITTGIWNAGAVTSSGVITGTSLVKSGGTAAQFLKADGSVDASIYLTSATGASTYLQLAGGTITGTVLAPTPVAATNTTQIATTAFVTTADNLKANTASPTFTGSTTISGSLTGGNAEASTIAGFSANINVQTGTAYTLTSADNGKIITLNNTGPITLTVPALYPGFNCMIVQTGAGQVTISASGVTVSNRNSYTKTAGTNAISTIIALSSNLFISSGDMSN